MWALVLVADFVIEALAWIFGPRRKPHVTNEQMLAELDQRRAARKRELGDPGPAR